MAGRVMTWRLLSCSRQFLTSSMKQNHASTSLSQRCIQEFVPSHSFHTSTFRLNQNIINIQDQDDFKSKVLESEKPVIVDFHASWCGPCKLLGPRLESLSAVTDGSAILAKVDIDELQDVAIEFGVEAVPTVYAMKGGKVQDKFVGLMDQDGLQAFAAKLTGQ